MRPNSRDRAKLNFGSMSFNDFRPGGHHQTKDPPKTFENGQRTGLDGMDLSDVRIGRLILLEHFYLPKITN